MSNSLSQPQGHSLFVQAKDHLINFFRQSLVKKSVNVLVPGVLAAVLFPVFGPAVAAPAAIVAIQNGLKILGITMSDGTIKKLLKPLEGQEIDENDLVDILEEVLPSDKQVNEEAAKALVIITPMVKDAALANPKLDVTWLGDSLEHNLKDQGETMAMIAHKVNELIQLDGTQLLKAKRQVLKNWTSAIQSIAVSGSGEVSSSPQNIKGRGGNMVQSITVSEQGKVTGSPQSIDLA